MKKFIAVITVLLLTVSLMAGCKKDQPKPAPIEKEEKPDVTVEKPVEKQEEEPVIRIGGLKGPTSMGLVKLLEDNEAGDSLNKYEFSIYGAADELTPKLIGGELDIAAVPANLAAVLYNNTKGKVKLLAINTLGVIYIVENGDTVKSLAD
ncbi:MAG: ABC transporter substrate-binding protein, partial [Ruminococcaceae bacterium]|nr:ABC transporter substrate-binding protein [Oscillospiraceae bacterium]